MLLSQDRFETDVLGSAEPVLVDFYRPTCPPCRLLMPTINAMSEAGYRVCKVNVKDRPDLAIRHGVRQVPTVAVFRDGREVARFMGLQSERTLRETLERARAA